MIRCSGVDWQAFLERQKRCPPQKVRRGQPRTDFVTSSCLAQKKMPWVGAGIEATVRHPREANLVGVSHAAFAVAETGTVALASGPDNPVTLNYLPDYHIVVIERSRVVAFQEEIWAEYQSDGMPRALCLITGPSRTGDIEFDIQLGVHGPRNLHVIIVDSA